MLRRYPRASRAMSHLATSPTRTRPHNWKSLAPLPLPGPTFAGQTSLQFLPVPKLADTLTKLKESLRPIAWDAQEYDGAVKAIDEFSRRQGPDLQKRLEARKEDTFHWLEEWWDDGAYLTYRDSVVINVSYYYGFKEHPAHLPQTAAHRAASLVRAAMLFRQQFKLGAVPPEATKDGPLCMDTWRWTFDCCRVPGPEVDWSVSHAKEGETGDSGHVVVLRRGRAWKLEPWHNGQLLSLEDLQKQIEHIYANTTEEHPAVGVLTASNRDVWAKDYSALTSDHHNASILSTIHSSAFVLCLDDESAGSKVARSRNLWHGAVTPQPGGVPRLGLRNRWMDKPCQFIVADDGTAGFVGEHSVMDGTPTMTLCDRVLDIIAAPEFASAAAPAIAAPPPTPLDWNVSRETHAAIESATRAAVELINSQTLDMLRTPYGKRAIKAFGVSPDSYAQLLIQLAYGRLLRKRGEKRRGGTYEAATTRRFLKGRTEVIRVVSSESDAWVASMDNASVDVAQRGQLFASAAKTHGALARAAGAGHGVDRHLLGLKKSLRDGEPLPAIFSDPVVARSSYWVLSTSAINCKHFDVYGWGEVVPDGFGIPYVTGFDDYLQFTVTSRTEMPNAEFCAELQQAAKDMYDLHVALADAKKGLSSTKAKL